MAQKSKWSFQDSEAIDVSGDFISVGDDEVSDNLVLRKLFPDKQPIHRGELEKLVDADVLDINSQKEREVEDEKDKGAGETEAQAEKEEAEKVEEQKEDHL